jgi:ribosomal protein S18 acetylase RimI-like enzyme
VNFRTNSGYLKGRVNKIFFVEPDQDNINISVGYGSDTLGSWGRGKYFIEIIFMSEMMAHIPFEIGDDFVNSNFVVISNIEILPEYRNYDIGKMVIKFAIDFFFKRGPEDVPTERRCNVDFTYSGFNQAFE